MNATIEPIQLPQLLTIPAAADYLGLSEDTLRDAVEAGQIPTLEIGKRRLVSRPFLENWHTEGGRR